MYDDLHTYVKAGTFAQKMDNFDNDSTTVSEYDDPQKRSTPAWIMNGGVTKKPATKKSRKSMSKGKGANKSKNSIGKKAKKDQKNLFIGKSDTYDKDPYTVSMYDDLHT
jgi:hypothetical protein